MSSAMFNPRTAFTFINHARNFRVLSLLFRDVRNFPNTLQPICSNHLLGIQANPVPIQIRCYAKGKDKKKEKGKTKVHINETLLAEVINVEAFKKNMEHTIELMKDDFTKNLSLRSTTGAIESLIVNLDGVQHTLQELAQISRRDPKTVILNMAVFPQAIPAVLKALSESGMNLSPQQEGTTLYIPIPKVTKEHRENLAKRAKAVFVKYKDKLKDVQNKEIKSLKKKTGISEDVIHSAQQQIMAITDSYVSEAEKLLLAKQNELLGK